MQVRVLGSVDVVVDGVPREVRGLRRKTVLAVLALHAAEIVSAGRLIDVVWGDRPPTTAANTLQRHVSYLRGVLGDRAAIKARPPGYVLDIGTEATDLRVAQRLIQQGKQSADPAVSASCLRAALMLWRDQPLADVTGLGGQAERLAMIRLEAVEALTEARLALGEHAQLVMELEQLSEQHPFREHIHRQLMLALYRTGRQVDALAVYQRMRQSLGDGLGMDPSPALRDLEAAVLRQDPELDPPGQVVAAVDLSSRTGRGVRFVETPAGRVAYTVVGDGPPLLCLLGWVSHLGLLWDHGDPRRFVELLAREHTVILYDKIGCGLSDRARTDFTIEFELGVLDALVEHVGLDRFALFGTCESGQVAAAYAATRPDALSSLIVYGTCARGRDLARDEVQQSVLALVRAHWGLGSRVLADIWLPGAPADLVEVFARTQRASATVEVAASLLEMFYRSDVTDLLPAIQVPTLVVNRRDSRAVRFELGRELAALIPDAQLVTLAGRMQPIYVGNVDHAASVLTSFLGTYRPG
ncbi:hypothetical protein ALI144C_23880 [Actinosynnema sp. ALI-1.44]|uniref:alpha/beta fold hydrolase n=1 Tax=Actinosynnema sp. ALI-1.44 TaxID=1933779 RepID=UPI0009C8FBE0|nr:alpha/beta fold hydrolase [Actinosynnema sp. ALI-1.44]ONI79784.1 hypothetical protein ALI144C_23880 [Actinosynnema sp. ALI-1.44]